MNGRRPLYTGTLLPPPDAEPWRKSSTGSTGSSIISSGSNDSTITSLSSRRSSSSSTYGCGCNQCSGRRLSVPLAEAAAAASSRGVPWKDIGGVSLRCLHTHSEASWREVECRQRLGQHPHLQGCLAATHTPRGMMLFLEAAPCGDLSAFLRLGGVGEERARLVARQVGAALQHVHARGLVHCDLKPRHVLVWDRGLTYFRVGGLHAARPLGTTVEAEPRGPMTPPEVWTGDGDPYAAHPSQDAWQLGLLLVACLTGTLPWAAADPADPHYAAWASWACRASTRLPPEFMIFSSRFLRLLRRLLHPDPARRAGVRAVNKYLHESWLAGGASLLSNARRGLTRVLTSLKSHLSHAPPTPGNTTTTTTTTLS